MKYKVGDKIRIRKDLRPERYGSLYATENMTKMAGDIVTIAHIYDERMIYDIEEDCGWSWSEEMFESVCPKNLLEPGTVVKTRDGDKYININGILMRKSGGSWLCRLEDVNDDLVREKHKNKDMEIIEIYKTDGHTISELFDDDNLTLVWKREEVKEITLSEIEKELGYKVKIVKEKVDNNENYL